MRPDRFEMFCLYYLGLNRAGEYRFLNANQIARELNWTVGELMGTLQKLNIHPDTVLNTEFPLARHQVDVQLAADHYGPPDLQDMAGRIFEEFTRSMGRKRDWLGEIEREREADRDAKRNR